MFSAFYFIFFYFFLNFLAVIDVLKVKRLNKLLFLPPAGVSIKSFISSTKESQTTWLYNSTIRPHFMFQTFFFSIIIFNQVIYLYVYDI